MAKSGQITDDFSVGKNLAVSGNIGIGQAAGANKLAVGGDAYVSGLLTVENLTGKQGLNIKGALSLAGTFGVGVATPQATLHVGGDGKFDGDIRA